MTACVCGHLEKGIYPSRDVVRTLYGHISPGIYVCTISFYGFKLLFFQTIWILLTQIYKTADNLRHFRVSGERRVLGKKRCYGLFWFRRNVSLKKITYMLIISTSNEVKILRPYSFSLSMRFLVTSDCRKSQPLPASLTHLSPHLTHSLSSPPT